VELEYHSPGLKSTPLFSEREGVTAYRLRKNLGIDQGQLSKFFTGKVNILLELLEWIASSLGYDLVLVKRKRPEKGGK
jgi:hypothetical protein